MASDFFETTSYFVDKRSSFRNQYHIYNDKRERIGLIKQKTSIPHKILRFVVGKTLFPFCLEIRSANGGLEASISKQSFLVSEIIVKNGYKEKIGAISKKLFKPEFKILNPSNEIIAEIRDALKDANLVVYNSAQKQIGSVAIKKTNGSARYNLIIIANYQEHEDKMAVLSSALIVNMFL